MHLFPSVTRSDLPKMKKENMTMDLGIGIRYNIHTFSLWFFLHPLHMSNISNAEPEISIPKNSLLDGCCVDLRVPKIDRYAQWRNTEASQNLRPRNMKFPESMTDRS